MAIDDISFTTSMCALNPPEVISELASLTSTTTASTVAPSITGEIDCNFDNRDICGWIHDNTADFEWIINRGSTSFFDTGPSTGI